MRMIFADFKRCGRFLSWFSRLIVVLAVWSVTQAWESQFRRVFSWDPARFVVWYGTLMRNIPFRIRIQPHLFIKLHRWCLSYGRLPCLFRSTRNYQLKILRQTSAANPCSRFLAERTKNDNFGRTKRWGIYMPTSSFCRNYRASRRICQERLNGSLAWVRWDKREIMCFFDWIILLLWKKMCILY